MAIHAGKATTGDPGSMFESVPYLPTTFLAVSYKPGMSPEHDGPGGEHRVRESAAMLGARVVWAPSGSNRVWMTGAESWDSHDSQGRPFSSLLSRVPRGTISASAAAVHLRDVGLQSAVLDSSAASAFSCLVPPFAAVSCTGPDAP